MIQHDKFVLELMMGSGFRQFLPWMPWTQRRGLICNCGRKASRRVRGRGLRRRSPSGGVAVRLPTWSGRYGGTGRRSLAPNRVHQPWLFLPALPVLAPGGCRGDDGRVVLRGVAAGHLERGHAMRRRPHDVYTVIL